MDSNFMDAKPPEEDPSHNMCSLKNNKADATCSAAGGPESIESCPGWFRKLWIEQKGRLAVGLTPQDCRPTHLEMSVCRTLTLTTDTRIGSWSCSRSPTATWQFVVTHFPCGAFT